jgi:hypothetical protein
MHSKLLSDAQLSLEGNEKWLTTSPVPPWLVYARQLIWQEPFAPNPRCLFGCEILAYTTRSAQTENPGAASRVLYLLADDRDGWFPVPPDGDEHGGELITVASFRHARPADVYTPAIQAADLARWRSRRSIIADYWAKFQKLNPQVTWPALTGIVVPPAPAPVPKRGFLSMFGGW